MRMSVGLGTSDTTAVSSTAIQDISVSLHPAQRFRPQHGVVPRGIDEAGLDVPVASCRRYPRTWNIESVSRKGRQSSSFAAISEACPPTADRYKLVNSGSWNAILCQPRWPEHTQLKFYKISHTYTVDHEAPHVAIAPLLPWLGRETWW